MKRIISLCILGLTVSVVSAADLSSIPRKIGKEPKYQSPPKYCLLVFGSEAKTRVWLVQDGPVLYVDRNGNGDLTDAGERIEAAKSSDAGDGEFGFHAGAIRDGDRTHPELDVFVTNLDRLAGEDRSITEFLNQHPKAKGYSVRASLDQPGWKGSGINGCVQYMTFLFDVHGVLQFADKPAEAPIIHFGGQLRVTLFGQQRLMIDRDEDVVLGVGTPGVGPGTTAYIEYEGVIPADLNPVLEITYSPKKPGDSPVRERYELKERC